MLLSMIKNINVISILMGLGRMLNNVRVNGKDLAAVA